jgi:hypothetical protein
MRYVSEASAVEQLIEKLRRRIFASGLVAWTFRVIAPRAQLVRSAHGRLVAAPELMFDLWRDGASE